MPTDENNGVNPQNQQVNPNASDSDDFDFNFDDLNNDQGTQAGTGLSGDMQDQMRRQGRSGMFLTPDEAITKSNEDSDMNLGNIDISSTVQPQQRSGMFLTPDEEANKEESQIEGKQYLFQGTDESQEMDSDDSYLAGIDPNDVEDSQDDMSEGQENMQVQDNDYSQDKLDDEIEDLISFGDEQKAGNVDQGSSVVDQTVAQPENVNKGVEIQATPSVESAVEQPVEQPVDTVVQPEQGVESVELKNEEQNNGLIQNIQEGQDSQIVQDVELNTGVENSNVEGDSTNESKGGDSEDRLSQEDKKVEESFGPVPESISPDVDMSPENVGQNVENVISSSVDTVAQINDSSITGNVNSDVNVKPLEQNELHIENMGTDVVENGNGDLISDVGGMQQMNQENTYVPNEAEFTQMSNLLDSSSAGQIDLSNLDGGQGTDQQSQPLQNSVLDTTSPILGTENVQVENSMNNKVSQNEAVQSNLESNLNEELSKFGGNGEDLQQETSQMTKGEESQGLSQEVPQNVIENSSNLNENTSNGEINLDSLISGIEPVNQSVVQNGDVNNGSVIGAVNQGTTIGQIVQPVEQNKGKKQSGLKVLGMLFGVCVLLGVGVYVASKMFPEEFSKIFNKNDPVIGYLLGDDVANIDENNVDENNVDEENTDNIDENNVDEENTDNIDENNVDEENHDNVENSGDVVELPEEQPDPDSLAGLLEGDNNGENLENSGDIENNIGSGDENGVGEVSGELNELGENMVNGQNDNSTGSFDPFAEVGNLFDTSEINSKLNDYISKGQYYVDWGLKNSNGVVSRYGDYIVITAQEELRKLENGEEIDTIVFDKFEELLGKLSNLVQ